MGFNNQKFAAATGLFFDKANQIFHGEISGYPVYCKMITGRMQSMTVRLHGKAEEPDVVASALEAWRMGQTGVTQITYRNNEMITVLGIPARSTVDTLANIVFEMVRMAQHYYLRPCCMSCGREDMYSHYVLDGEGCTLCESCRMSTQENMEHIAMEKSSEPVNLLGTMLGLVIGAAVLFGVTFLILKMGYVTYLTGYLGALVTLLLMKKFGGRLTYPTAAIAVVVCLLVAAFTPPLEIAGDIAAFNQENRVKAQEFMDAYKNYKDVMAQATSEEAEEVSAALGVSNKELEQRNKEYRVLLDNQTTWECFRNLTKLTDYDMYEDVKGEIVKCMLWGVLSILIGCGVTLPAMLRESYGKHKLVRLS